jgi:undecaprenyl-diphosphatase
MDYFQIILLSVIQGLTEFLPVSSSGHLVLAPLIFDFDDQGLALDAILHLGTLLAIIIYFRHDLSELAASLWRANADPATRSLAVSLLLASIPAGALGYLAGETIEANLRNPTFVAINLLVWSAVFYIADRYSRRTGVKPVGLKEMQLGQVMLVGFAQALALLPGTSRSGITIAAGLFSNLAPAGAARFSFLLGTPVIFAAGIYELDRVFNSGGATLKLGLGQLACGLGVSFVVGLAAISLLLKIVSRVGLLPFIVYRVLLAVFILFVYSR